MQQKKLLLILAAMPLLLAGCGGTTSSSNAASSTPTSSSKTPTTSSSKTTSSAPSTTSEAASTSEEPDNGLNVFWSDGKFTFGTAASLTPGQMAYWAGEGGAINEASVKNGVYTLSYSNDGAWKFYAVQLFYKLPYGVQGDAYRLHMTLTSDIAGSITINSSKVDLKKGDNAYSASFTHGANETLSMQLGVSLPDSTPDYTLLTGYAFSFSNIRITDAVNTYHEVKFVDGTNTVKDIQVRDGKPVSAPANPTPAEGKIFAGWYNGEVKWTATSAISAATTFSAKYVDASQAHTVTFYHGTTVLGTVQVEDGNNVVLPSTLIYPFGYGEGKWYNEAALTSEFDFTKAIKADTAVYAKLYVKPSATCSADKASWGAIPASYISTNDAGGWVLSGYAGDGESGNWFTQINFGPVPTANAGIYTITFTYSINATGGQVSIYDDTSKGNVMEPVDLAKGDNLSAVTTYDAAGTSGNARIQFGLGLIAKTETVNFTISAVSVVLKAA